MSYIGTEPFLASFPAETFSGDGTTTIFTLAYNAGTASAIEINISGITQQVSSYSVVGTTLTFNVAPITGTDNIEVKYRGIENAVNVPALGSVEYTHLSSAMQNNIVSDKAIGNVNNPLVNLPLKNNLSGDFAGTLTFARTTTATYIDRYGVVQSAAIDEARFEKEGLLIEGASTNLLTYSEQFDNAIYTLVTDTTVIVDDTTAPDGTLTADRLTKTAATFAVRGQVATSAITGRHNASIFVKSGDLTEVTIGLFDGDGTVITRCVLDMTTGNLTAQIGSVNDCQVKILGNGWFRFSVAGTTTIANPQIRVYPGDATEAIAGYIFVWGAQLEELPFASSYIPTITVAVPRTVDNLTLSFDNNSPLSTSFTNGSIVVDFDVLNTISTSFTRSILTSDTTPATGYRSYIAPTTTNIIAQYQPDGSGTQNIVGTISSEIDRMVFTHDESGNVATFLDNVAGQTSSDTLGITAIPTTLIIGSSHSFTEHLYGHVSKIRIYDIELTAEEIRIA